MAADCITPEAINFMTNSGPRPSSVLSLTEQRLRRPRNLRQISPRKHVSLRPPRSASPIDAKRGTTTGISAADRAYKTIFGYYGSEYRGPEEFGAGLGTFTLCGPRNGGVLGACWADGSLLGSGAGLPGRESFGRDLRNHERGRHDGARLPQLIEFCRAANNLKNFATVADLIRYRMQHEAVRAADCGVSAAHEAWKFPDDRLLK